MARRVERASKSMGVIALVVGAMGFIQSWPASGQSPPAKGPGRSQPKAQAAPANDPPRSPLIKALHDAIDQAKDWDQDFGDRNELKKGLREADATLERIRRENTKALTQANRQPPTRRQPNLVLVVLGEAPRDHLGCYGQTAIQTPTIDRLAARGTRFTQLAAVPGEAATQFARLTGRTTKPGGPFALLPHETPVARLLFSAGYSTAWFGECQVDDPNAKINPTEFGFEEWYGTWDQPTSVYPERLVHLGKPVDIAENAGGKRGVYINELYTRQASAWIRQFDAAQAQRPFFLQVTYRVPGKDWEAPILEPYAAKNWSPAAKAWASLVTGVDREIEKLIQSLRDAKQLNQTIIVVTADPRRAVAPGDDLFAIPPSTDEKPASAAPGDHVPLVIYGYGRVAANQVADEPASMVDLAPTLAALAYSARAATSFTGRGLGDTLTSRPVPPETPAATPAPPAEAAPAVPASKPVRKLPQIIRGRP